MNHGKGRKGEERKGMIKGTRAPYNQLSGLGLNMFTNDELAEIHRATLDVLSNGGIMVLNDEAQEIFYSHGCKVDKKSNIVKIPAYLVEEAIQSAPSKVLLAARDPKYDIVLEGSRVAYTTFGTGIKFLDSGTGKVKETSNKELIEASILADACESVDVFSEPLTPRDVPPEIEDLIAAETCMTNCSKHFHHIDCLSAESIRKFFAMGAAIAGGEEEMRQRPVCSVLICPVSPLQLSPEAC